MKRIGFTSWVEVVVFVLFCGVIGGLTALALAVVFL